MATWACSNDITLTWRIYFEKVTTEEIIKLEFHPGAAMAYSYTDERDSYPHSFPKAWQQNDRHQVQGACNAAN